MFFRSYSRYACSQYCKGLSQLSLTFCDQVNGQLPPGINLVSADDLQTWIMDIKVMDANPIYQDQTYRLKFIFSGNYPIGDLLFFP